MCAGCSSPLHTVHLSSARSAHPVCTGHVSLLRMVCVSATQGHGQHSPLWDSHTATKSGAECSPRKLQSCWPRSAPRTPLPRLPWVPGGDAWSLQTTSANGAGLFFAGLDKAHQPLLASSKGSPHPPPTQSCPQAENTSCFIKEYSFFFFLIENTHEGTRKPPPTSLRAAPASAGTGLIPGQLLTWVPAPILPVLWLFSPQIPPGEAGKGTEAGGLCQTSVWAEPGAGRAGWHRQGAEVCAHVPPWHSAGNGSGWCLGRFL